MKIKYKKEEITKPFKDMKPGDIFGNEFTLFMVIQNLEGSMEAITLPDGKVCNKEVYNVTRYYKMHDATLLLE